MKLLPFAALMMIGATPVNAQQPPLPHRAQIVLAGGCFWGMQAVFQHTKGVIKTTSGYAGGEAGTAQYETVSEGRSGHAESVEVVYDPQQISLPQLLTVYFGIAHNPTELNYQGPDQGTQYRSAIFYATPEQRSAAKAMIDALQNKHVFKSPIVTRLEPFKRFYPAEAYHQDYARLHPYDPYIRSNDLPKVAALKAQMPQFYKP